MKRLKEITNGTIGYVIYSTKKNEIIHSYNQMEDFPLASAGKLAVGFAVSKWIEEGTADWAVRMSIYRSTLTKIATFFILIFREEKLGR